MKLLLLALAVGSIWGFGHHVMAVAVGIGGLLLWLGWSFAADRIANRQERRRKRRWDADPANHISVSDHMWLLGQGWRPDGRRRSRR